MKRNIWLMTALLSLASMKAVAQQPVVHFDMSLTQDGKITESVTKNAYAVTSQLPAFAVKSIDGDALRFDGYSNYVQTGLSSSSLSTTALMGRILMPEKWISPSNFPSNFCVT